MELVLAHVCPNMLETPTKCAGPSVSTTRTVPPTKRALEISVQIRVRARAVQMPTAK